MPGEFDPGSILRDSVVVGRLAPDALAEIARVARVARYPTKTLLWLRGATPDLMLYIVEGAIECSLTMPDGREASIPPCLPGDWMSWPACLMDDPLAYDVWAAASSVLLAIPKSVVRNGVVSNSRAMLEAFTIVGNQTRGLMRWHLATALVSDEHRLARLIAYVGERNRVGSKDQAMARVTQEQMSRLSFGSRHRARSALKNLEQAGLIELRYGGIVIPSVERLRDFGFGGQDSDPTE